MASWPTSQDKLPPQERDQYKAFEKIERLEGTVQGRKIQCKYRTILVWSEAKARQPAQTRDRHVAKIRAEFDKVQAHLNRYTLTTPDAIRKRLELAKAK